jgi:hypothetical protein
MEGKVLLGLTLLLSTDAGLVGVCQTTSPARELCVYLSSLENAALTSSLYTKIV